MTKVIIPENYNYIAAFLTLHCNLHCTYCINRQGDFVHRKLMDGKEWVSIINKIESRPDLPVTLQGGEPTLHPHFYYIVNNIKPELKLDLLTNCRFDTEDFMKNVKPERFNRDAPYASIRVSYHPEQMERKENHLIDKVSILQSHGYSIGIWAVDHPAYRYEIMSMRDRCARANINFLTKDFLGEYGGEFYGHYKYPEACGQKETKKVSCKTTELLIAPDGKTYRCHADLYANRYSIGDILDPEHIVQDVFRECVHFGQCSCCDMKVKYDRFGNKGWTSTEIKK